MDEFRIKNLKSLKDTGFFSIKPITVFIGQNSYGKSSIVRTLPLLKQSTESKTLGTILWDGKYVDFGSFEESINNNSKINGTNEIEFTFRFSSTRFFNRPNYSHYSNQSAPSTQSEVIIKIHGDEYKSGNYSEIEYKIYNQKIVVKFNSKNEILKLEINGADYSSHAREAYSAYKSYNLLPIFIRNREKQNSVIYNLYEKLKKYSYHKTSRETILRLATNLPFTTNEVLKRYLSTKGNTGEYFAKKFQPIEISHDDFKNIRNDAIFNNLDKVFDSFSDGFRHLLSNLRYITPLRAAADRYYRIKNISISELDPNGSNLAMFLHAKSKEELRKISNWIYEDFGFGIEISANHGHASIYILDIDNQEKINITDTGFGISQILPILIEIWEQLKSKSAISRVFSIPSIIIIEQPELHLHPRMQFKTGELFCKAIRIARENKIDLRIIIETHSKEIIDSIGKSIEKETITKDDASIYIVDKRNDINLKESKFDKSGYLTEWPYGFFDGH